MADLKTELLISIPAEKKEAIPAEKKEEARGPPSRSLDYFMFQGALFFVPTIGLVPFEKNHAQATGVPAAALEKVEFIFPLYRAIVAFSIVTVIFTWIFRTSGMSTSAGILNCINAFLICVLGPMLVWQLLTLQAYHFFGMLAAAIVLCAVCVVVGDWWEKKKSEKK